MRWIGTFLFVVAGMMAAPALAQSPPTQCLSIVQAGGTGDAIQFPKLPCWPTTTMTMMYVTGNNMTDSPMISVLNAGPALPLVNFDGTPLAPGDLLAGEHILLGFDGAKWFTLTGPATAKLPPTTCPVIDSYGGSGDNTVDNVAAFNAALAAQPALTKCVTLGRGTYYFGSTISISLAAGEAITVQGQGQQVSAMRWHGIDGFHFSQGNQQSVIHFRSLTALTDVSDGGTWVTMTGVGNQHQPTYSDFTDVTIAGDDYLGHWWTMGVLSNSWGNLNFINFEYWGATPNVPLGWGNGYFTTVGKAVDLEADADKVSVDYNFFNPNLNYVGTAITYGNNVQGVNVVGGNIVGGDYGIFVPFNADTGTDQLTITGITISVRTADVQTLQGVFGTTISNSFLTCGPGGPATPSSPGLGIDLEGANSFSITGNVIECGDAGVGYGNDIVVANGGGGTIVGNTLGNSATAIWLKAASSNVYVANNYSQNVTNKVLNDGTNNSIDYDRIGLTFNNGIALFGRDTSGSPHPLIYLDGLNNLGLYNGKVQVYDTGDLGSSGSLLSNGNIALDGTGGDFIAHGHAGLDCSGTPTSGFATSSGIVTHC